MGKHGKKVARQRTRILRQEDEDEDEDEAEGSSPLPSHGVNHHHTRNKSPLHEDRQEDREENEDSDGSSPGKMPSKFSLYQQSVQSPKGDISYLRKFFLMYVGGRNPLHLQEDFCGTGLLSAEWIHGDPRRTAIGVDLDLEALMWCLENNIAKLGPDGYSRVSLFHGNVLKSLDENHHVECGAMEMSESLESVTLESSIGEIEDKIDGRSFNGRKQFLPPRDIICAFNYSCCCLHRRSELLVYFKHVLNGLSRKGGIFVMDLYGGTSSEHPLRLQRRYPGFTYIWEQADFNVLSRTTTISLHFNFPDKKPSLRHAFSYHWRLWSLPEIKDCLEESGFHSVHFWIREMPDTNQSRNTKEYNGDDDVKYEEVSSFSQLDAWNAYVVGVVKAKC